jgi:hypothetical protein
MLRVYRGIIIAIVGLLAFVASLGGAGYFYYRFQQATEDAYPTDRYQPARDARVPAARPKGQPQPRAYQPNCQQPQSHEDADLCAQWGAVKAVTETNRLTRLALQLASLGFIFAVFGAIISVGGTILIWLAYQETRSTNRIARRDYGKARLEARAAARDTEAAHQIASRNAYAAREAADAAARGNVIAQHTQVILTRPYVHLIGIGNESTQLEEGGVKFRHATFNLAFQNFGASPAQKVTLRARAFPGPYWSDDFPPELEAATAVPLGVIPPGRHVEQEGYATKYPVSEHQFYIAGAQSIFVEGQIQYQDAFGTEYFTNFRQVCSGLKIKSFGFRPAPRWNEAS